MPLLPPLADVNDLELLLSSAQIGTDRAVAAVAAASALVRAYTRNSWTDEITANAVPDPVQQATLNIARRVYLAPDDNVTAETTGPYSVTRSGGLWLSSTDRMLLAGYRRGGGHQSVSPDSLSTLWYWNDALIPVAGQPEADPIGLTLDEVTLPDLEEPATAPAE
jgi:hypothetical protein